MTGNQRKWGLLLLTERDDGVVLDEEDLADAALLEDEGVGRGGAAVGQVVVDPQVASHRHLEGVFAERTSAWELLLVPRWSEVRRELKAIRPGLQEEKERNKRPRRGRRGRSRGGPAKGTHRGGGGPYKERRRETERERESGKKGAFHSGEK